MLIKKLRLQRSWSQEQLAQMSGLSVRTIQRIEKGKQAGFESLKSLAAVFEIDVSELTEHYLTHPEKETTEESNMQPSSETTQSSAPSPAQLTAQEAKAIEHVENLKSFYMHLAVYILVMIFLTILNAVTSSRWWVIWPMMGWGLGLAIHGATVLLEGGGLFNAEWERKQIEKRLGRKL